MRFVFGRSCERVEPGWFLLLEPESLAFADGRMERGFQPYLRGLKTHIETNAHVLVLAASAHMRARFGLSDRLGWYMNPVGGMCPTLIDVTREVDADQWPQDRPWTLDDIKLTQWQGGKHWYATLPDGTRIKWGGLDRWVTPESARKAAQAFLNASV